MFKTRLLSGILLVIIALITVISGGGILFATMLVISLVGMTELYKVFEIHKSPLGICGYIFAILYYAALYHKEMLMERLPEVFVLLFVAMLICLMAVMVFTYPKYRTEQVMAAFFGMIYVAVMLSFIYQTRILDGGVFTVWLVFICAWGLSLIHILEAPPLPKMTAFFPRTVTPAFLSILAVPTKSVL